jgi:hypothetical protein
VFSCKRVAPGLAKGRRRVKVAMPHPARPAGAGPGPGAADAGRGRGSPATARAGSGSGPRGRCAGRRWRHAGAVRRSALAPCGGGCSNGWAARAASAAPSPCPGARFASPISTSGVGGGWPSRPSSRCSQKAASSWLRSGLRASNKGGVAAQASRVRRPCGVSTTHSHCAEEDSRCTPRAACGTCPSRAPGRSAQSIAEWSATITSGQRDSTAMAPSPENRP